MVRKTITEGASCKQTLMLLKEGKPAFMVH